MEAHHRQISFWSSQGEVRFSDAKNLTIFKPTWGWHLYSQPPNDAKYYPWGFGFESTTDKTVVAAPHWILIVTFFGLAALPWFPFKRFSLRTLLIAVTLGSIVLGLIAWALKA